MIYEPEWSAKKRYKDYDPLMMFLMSLFMTVAIFGALLIMGIPVVGDPLLFIVLLMMPTMMVAMVVLSTWSLYKQIKQMPLRVYEAGVTKPEVPFWRGLRGLETLIPWSTMERLDVRSMEAGAQSSKFFKLMVKDDDTSQVLDMSKVSIDDSLSFLLAFEKYMPEIMTEAVKEILNPDEEHLTDLEDEIKGYRSLARHRTSFIWMFLGGGGFVSAFTVGLFVDLPLRPLMILVLIAVYTPMAVFYLFATYKAIWASYDMMWINPENEVLKTGVRVPTSRIVRATFLTDDVVPFRKIERLRKGLTSQGFTPKYELLSTEEERFMVHRRLFKAMDRSGRFRRDRFELVNDDVDRGLDGHLAKFNPWTFIALVVIVVAISNVLLFGAMALIPEGFWDGGSEPPSEESDEFMVKLRVYTMLAMLPFMLATMIIVRRRMGFIKRGRQMLMDDEELRCPNVKGPLGTIKRAEIRLVEAFVFSKRPRMNGVRIKTDRGDLELPGFVWKTLKDHGCIIDDPRGLLNEHVVENQG
jgi:hypothetical protein